MYMYNKHIDMATSVQSAKVDKKQVFFKESWISFYRNVE